MIVKDDMTDYRIEQIVKAGDILTSLYWEMVDNKENDKEIRRLDTILGKLYQLKRLIGKEKDR